MSPDPRDRSAETRDLAERLVRELEPVRRIPPLRVVLAATLSLVGLGTGWAVAAAGGVRSDLGAVLAQHPGFVAIGLGLAAVGLGGTLAAVATSVPGRDALERAGRRLLALGAAIAFLFAPSWILLRAAGVSLAPGPAELMCLEGAVWVALLPGAAVLVFVFRAAPRHPLAASLLGVVGAAAWGSLAMHARCPHDAASHWVLGHAWAPLLAGVAALLPLALVALRARRR